MLRKGLLAVAALAAALVAALYLVGSGLFGRHWGPAPPNPTPRSEESVVARADAQTAAAGAIGVAHPKQVLFGDLHVHSTFSLDAFMMALPTGGGEGAHPVNDACDFARYCSALDFWSINDHALSLTPTAWRETVASVRACNAVAGDAGDPDLSAFLGWEWTQVGTNPDNHYGHKNVIFRDLADGQVPTRPIASRAPATDAGDATPGTLAYGLLGLSQPNRDSMDLVRYFHDMTSVPACPEGVPEREISQDCRESAATPAELFAKLDDWGFDSLVIPHGTTWGFYTPPGSAWDKQLKGAMHDPTRQKLIEVFSGHGNSEEYRSWREVRFAKDGTPQCPVAVPGYLPGCRRAGEIIRKRCVAAGEAAGECAKRAEEAQRNYVEAGLLGHLTVPGARPDDWLDANQCTDCFQPAFNYRPRSSVQYIMALRNFADPATPRRFAFGFLASSDNHTGRPGTGYKEYARDSMTEARLTTAALKFLPVEPPGGKAIPRSRPWKKRPTGMDFFAVREAERASSFFLTGGLVAVHSAGRDRDAIWNALERREVYGTSGPRILLWFDLLNPPGSKGRPLPMGSDTKLSEAPIFQVRAVGSFRQKPGCPPDAARALGPERLEKLCHGQCYFPGDRRRQIRRIEVVRIRPQQRPGEPVDGLIEDPWRSFACEPGAAGCSVTFSDPDFVTSSRDALYYVRAIEEPSLAVGADPLRCERDAKGRCVRVHPCKEGDDCLAQTEERAWSSPVFVAYEEEGS